jgi:glycosyltransferase involved in cell wall biosynthesis
MVPKPLVSVIVIFLNASDFLQAAIESVLAQTYEHWELLLVDDGSNDGSTEIAMSYASENSARIKYFEHDGHQNLGMSAARNLGIRKAKGKYIAFLDADDYWLPERLETHVKILESYPEAGMLFGSTMYWYSWTGHSEDSPRDFIPKLRVRENTLFHPPQSLLSFLDGSMEVPCTCSILVRKESIMKVGGFEESFRGMYEDQAFYAKIFLGVVVVAVSDCLAWYRQHSESHSSISAQSGQSNIAQDVFLKWLEIYCHETGMNDEGIRKVIRRRLWLNHNPSPGHFPYLPSSIVRRIKKWIMRLEDLILPSGIQARFRFRHRN